MGFSEQDRDIGPKPLGPDIDFSTTWSPDDAFPGVGRPPNNVQVSAMLPQPVYRAMQVLVHREDTPFGSPSDVIRAAVWHYLRAVQKAIDEHHPAYVDALHREQLRANNEQLAQQHEKLGETLEHVHDQFTALLDSGTPAYGEIARRVEDNSALADLLGDYWRGVYRNAIGDMAVVKAAKEVIDARARATGTSPHHAVDPGMGPANRRKDPGVPVDPSPDTGDSKGDQKETTGGQHPGARYPRDIGYGPCGESGC